MAIYQRGTSGVVPLEPQPFDDERELEAALAETPNILREANGPDLVLVARQVGIPQAGILDLLLLDSRGTVVAVEVKLGRNGGSRREVVGQVVDYVSMLTSMTADELDRSVGGALKRAAQSVLGPNPRRETYESLWTDIGTNLRAGLARYVVATDDPPLDLQRIVGFLAGRSNLRVSLIAVAKHVDAGGQPIYVPRSAERDPRSAAPPDAKQRRVPSSDFQAVLDAYTAIAGPGCGLSGQAYNYRQIRPRGWPAGLHYEFLKTVDAVGVEIHLESKAALTVSTTVQALARKTIPDSAQRLQWESAWTYGPRLYVKFPVTTPPERVAAAMKQLIDLTYRTITLAL